MKGKERILLTIHVYPRSRKREIEKLDSGEYRVRVLSPPFKGEANKEVIETVASYFNLPPSRIKIAKGLKSRRKLIILELDKEPRG